MSRGPWRSLTGVGLIVLTVGLLGDAGATAQRSSGKVPGVLACGREALGGAAALSAVSSLAVTFSKTPAPGSRYGRPSTDEIVLSFPNTFRSTARFLLPSGRGFVWVSGFVGNRQLDAVSDGPVVQDSTSSAASLRQARSGFAHWALVLLLRETAAVPLTWSGIVGSQGEQLRISATGPNDFHRTLFLDKVTCLPMAAEWDRPPNFDDAKLGRAPASAGRHVERYELLDYETFQGVRLPRRIRTATDGVARAELTLTSAQINPRLPDDLEASPRAGRGKAAGRR